MPEENELKNIEFRNDSAILKIKPNIFSIDVIRSAAYIMIDKAFIVLDGKPDEEILVEIKKSDDFQEIKSLVKEFYAELLNYAVYKSQTEKNAGVREIILHRALLTNVPQYTTNKTPTEKIPDPQGIAKKWEENEENKTE